MPNSVKTKLTVPKDGLENIALKRIRFFGIDLLGVKENGLKGR